MTTDQFRALLERRFHGSIHYMQAWAKKLMRRHRDGLPVSPMELQSARTTLVYIDEKGLA